MQPSTTYNDSPDVWSGTQNGGPTSDSRSNVGHQPNDRAFIPYFEELKVFLMRSHNKTCRREGEKNGLTHFLLKNIYTNASKDGDQQGTLN